ASDDDHQGDEGDGADASHHQRPEHRAAAGLMDKDQEPAKAEASENGVPESFRASLGVAVGRDKNDGHGCEGEADPLLSGRKSLEKTGGDDGERRSEYSGHGRDESHLANSHRAVERSEREAAHETSCDPEPDRAR